jgi:hypothetical protein
MAGTASAAPRFKLENAAYSDVEYAPWWFELTVEASHSESGWQLEPVVALHHVSMGRQCGLVHHILKSRFGIATNRYCDSNNE